MSGRQQRTLVQPINAIFRYLQSGQTVSFALERLPSEERAVCMRTWPNAARLGTAREQYADCMNRMVFAGQRMVI